MWKIIVFFRGEIATEFFCWQSTSWKDSQNEKARTRRLNEMKLSLILKKTFKLPPSCRVKFWKFWQRKMGTLDGINLSNLNLILLRLSLVACRIQSAVIFVFSSFPLRAQQNSRKIRFLSNNLPDCEAAKKWENTSLRPPKKMRDGSKTGSTIGRISST